MASYGVWISEGRGRKARWRKKKKRRSRRRRRQTLAQLAVLTESEEGGQVRWTAV